MPQLYVLVWIGSMVELSLKASYYSIPESHTNIMSRIWGSPHTIHHHTTWGIIETSKNNTRKILEK